MAAIESNKLKYEFKFNKLGLDPNEFEDCLKQKVEQLLKTANLQGSKKTLKPDAIKKVEQLYMKKNRTCKGMDNRRKSVKMNIDAGYLRHPKDTPMDYNKDSGGRQGEQKKQKEWHKGYHERQYKLCTGPLGQKFQTLFPTISISDDETKQGYLFHSTENGEERLTTIEFCNVIDGVTNDLVKNLSALTEKKQLPDASLDFKEVSELCEAIVSGRNNVDWVVYNDLMKEEDWKNWRDHVMVVISFGALMVVTEMICNHKPGRKPVRRALYQTKAQSPLEALDTFLSFFHLDVFSFSLILFFCCLLLNHKYIFFFI